MSGHATTVAIGDVDLDATLRPVAFLRGDPTVDRGPGRFARATTTPDGPGVVAVRWGAGNGEARVSTAGPGGPWLHARVEGLLGLADDPTGFAPTDEPLRSLWRRRAHLRLTRTGTLWHDLACTVVQQRITVADAADQWRRLVRALGTPIDPGDGGPTLLAPPAPGVVATMPYHHLHPYGIERRRAETLRRAAVVAARLATAVDGPAAAPLDALGRVPGIGPWTVGNVAATTWGDADAVILGDDGLPGAVAWALAREQRADDDRMVELLAPYRPHRYRVVRLVMHAGAHPPRRHPRGHRRDIRRQ